MRKRGKKSLVESAAELAESVMPTIESAVETVTEKTAPIVAEGRQIVAEGRQIATEGRQRAAEGRQIAGEKVRRGKRRAAAKAAAFAAADPRDKLAAARAAEPAPEKKGGKLKKLLLLGGLVALGGFVAKKLTGGKSQGNWQPTYTPSPAPKHAAATAAPSAPVPDDQAAASPDEVLADQAAEPHPDTTPDDPAQVVELGEFADASEESSAPAEPVTEAQVEEASIEQSQSPYGEGSALPGPGGEAPSSDYRIKGNRASKVFHTIESPYYERTTAEVWFTNEVAAEAAGFRHWKAAKD